VPPGPESRTITKILPNPVPIAQFGIQDLNELQSKDPCCDDLRDAANMRCARDWEGTLGEVAENVDSHLKHRGTTHRRAFPRQCPRLRAGVRTCVTPPPVVDDLSATVLDEAVDTLGELRTPYWLGDSAVRLHTLANLLAQAQVLLPAAVAQARDQDLTWDQIGELLGITGPTATRRYRPANHPRQEA
jgi:hypothetical protein